MSTMPPRNHKHLDSEDVIPFDTFTMRSIPVTEKIYDFFKTFDKRYYVLHGGRGSGKSWQVAIHLLLFGYKKKLRILCCRETMASLDDSSITLLKDTIERVPEFKAFYTIQKNKIMGRNGTEFKFKGLRENAVSTVKSSEGFDICWIEEAQYVTRYSLDVVIPTIRKSGSKFIFTMNPENEDDPVYADFIKEERDDTAVAQINWRDNPFFSSELNSDRCYLKHKDFDKYLHVWEGEILRQSFLSVFYGCWEVTKDLPGYYESKKYYGMDFGFSNDPSTLVECYIYNDCLYVSDLVYEYGLKLKHYDKAFSQMPLAKLGNVRADNSRAESIDYLRDFGWDVRECDKWAGCVEDGVEYLKNFDKIYIYEDLRAAIVEAKKYEFKQLRNGAITRYIKDDYNHFWDALRYALEDFITRGNTPLPTRKENIA